MLITDGAYPPISKMSLPLEVLMSPSGTLRKVQCRRFTLDGPVLPSPSMLTSAYSLTHTPGQIERHLCFVPISLSS